MNFRFLLLPFSLIYGFVIFIRNRCYDLGVLKVNKFSLPLIGVGNITTGGTGKTPHIEYLINLLSPASKVATLSRGYGRKTNGFAYAEKNSFASEVGDEPLQLKNKVPAIGVAVCENRKTGIEKILKDEPETKVVLLDDAFQHRAVNPSLSILLLEYSKIFKSDFLLPAGNLREPFSAKKRADIIVVSKYPLNLSDEEREKIILKIAPDSNQKLFFSGIVYNNLHPVFESNDQLPQTNASCLLVTGIADASGIKQHCELNTKLFRHLEFADHHAFSGADIRNIIKIFSTIAAENKIIITTEKDAMRLKVFGELNNLPLYYLPVSVKFLDKDEQSFNQLILQHVGKN